MFYILGCFPYISRVVVRVEEIFRVKMIVRVEVIPYMLAFPSHSQNQTVLEVELLPISTKVIVTVEEINRTKVMIRVKAIPYKLGLRCHSQSYTDLCHIKHQLKLL